MDAQAFDHTELDDQTSTTLGLQCFYSISFQTVAFSARFLGRVITFKLQFPCVGFDLLFISPLYS